MTTMTPTNNPFLEDLQREIEETFIQLQASNNTESCIECKQGPLYPCNRCGDGTRYCWDHAVRHTALLHREDPTFVRVRNRVIKKFMTDHHLTAFTTPGEVITLLGPMKNKMKSCWFDEAHFFGIEDPALITWSPPRVPRDQDRAEADHEFASQVKRFLDILDLRAYNFTGAENYTLFAGRRSNLDYLPQDITQENQDSASGLFFMPGADAGKIAKRLKVHTLAEGAYFIPSPSHFPYLKVPGETQVLHVHDSGTAGDGSGAYRESAGRRLLKAANVPTWGDIIAIQTVFLGADYSGKGLFPLIPDRIFPKPDVDLMIDAESVNRQVRSTKYTKGKVIPIRHKPNKRYFFVEPLILAEVVNRFISAQELVDQASLIAEKADEETWKEALNFDQNWLEQIALSLGVPSKSITAKSHLERAKSQLDPDNRLLLDFKESGQSPFASPKVTELTSGAPANSLQASQRKSSPMPGIIASGEKVLLMHPPYAGVNFPKTGFARLIWHFDKPDQLIGMGFSKKDMLKHRDALDTADCDDHIQLIFLQDQRGAPHVLVLRTPLSIDGGVCIRLTLSDAAKLKSLGYHFYQKAGDHKFPGLHTIAEDGNPVFPYILNPEKFDTPPAWTTNEDLAMRRMLELTQYRGTMGLVCNLAANLDYAGIYDPAKHKFNMSDSIIDPSLNASADPSPIVHPLAESLLEAILEGKPVDPCVFGRVSTHIEGMYNARARQKGSQLPPFQPVLQCQSHHQHLKDGMTAVVKFLNGTLNARKLLANGPPAALLKDFGQGLTDIAIAASEERYKVWSEKNRKTKLVSADPDLDSAQKDAAKAQLLQDAKDQERTIIQQAYLKANAEVPDYNPGDLMAIWFQLATNSTRRYKGSPRPITTSATSYLPEEEHTGFYQTGPTLPTLIVPTPEEVDTGHPGPWTLQADQDERGKTPNRLVSADGNTITEIPGQNPAFRGLKFKPLGYMPTLQVQQETTSWEQQPNLLVLEVTNPQATLGTHQEDPGS